MPTTDLHIVMVGGGLTALPAAALLARGGARVTVLERDPDGPPGDAAAAWDGWDRSGVPQFRQLHIMLPRWTAVMQRELPEVLDQLRILGGEPVNILHMNPRAATGGWQAGDEEFETLTARRPVLETAVARVAQATPGVRVRRGVAAIGLLTTAGDGGIPRVVGVRTDRGDIAADLVVDAAGRHTPVPRFVREAGAREPFLAQALSGFTYYTRYYRTRDGGLPPAVGSALSHHESYSLLTLPSDNGTWSVGIIASSKDRALHVLRTAAAWEAAVRATREGRAWIEAEPITPVMPFAGIEDVRRSYLVDGIPVVTGLVPLGDARAATNPSLGRGASIGLLHACVLRDVVAAAGSDAGSVAFAEAFEAATDAAITPFVESTIDFGRHRLAEIQAEVEGGAYETPDAAWAMTRALMAGARSDPVLVRAYGRIGSLLALPAEVFATPEVLARVQRYLPAPRYPDGDCDRAQLLAAAARSASGVPALEGPPPSGAGELATAVG
jgi:2-polyprenyl-6-methoxyphenol hydroxylase-like FAD-dependent oxidoreductase